MTVKGAGEGQRDGIRRAYTTLFLMMMELVEELGSDRALEILRRTSEREARILEKELEGRPTIPNPLERGLEAYRIYMEGLGAEVETHLLGKASITLRVERCPLYEAMLSVGVDCGHLQGGICKNLVLPTMQEILKRIEPKLRIRTRLTRQSIEEFCLEEIYIEG